MLQTQRVQTQEYILFYASSASHQLLDSIHQDAERQVLEILYSTPVLKILSAGVCNLTISVCSHRAKRQRKQEMRELQAARLLYKCEIKIRWEQTGVSDTVAKLMSPRFKADFSLLTIHIRQSFLPF